MNMRELKQVAEERERKRRRRRRRGEACPIYRCSYLSRAPAPLICIEKPFSLVAKINVTTELRG